MNDAVDPWVKRLEAVDTPWYLLRAATRQEKRACASLDELGIANYLPCETVERKLCRQKEIVERPLFPGYLFAQVPDALFHVAINADGVHGPVRVTNGAGERVPRTVGARMVQALQEAQAAGEFDRTKVPPMQPGDRIRIVDGPFEGRFGQLLKVKSGDRLQLILEGYGKTTIASASVEFAA